MNKAWQLVEILNSALEAGLEVIVSSSVAQINSEKKAITLIVGLLTGAFVTGGATMNWVTAQKDLPARVQAIEIELQEKRVQDESLYKMVCEIRATIRGSDPLPCWRGEIVDNVTGGR